MCVLIINTAMRTDISSSQLYPLSHGDNMAHPTRHPETCIIKYNNLNNWMNWIGLEVRMLKNFSKSLSSEFARFVWTSMGRRQDLAISRRSLLTLRRCGNVPFIWADYFVTSVQLWAFVRPRVKQPLIIIISIGYQFYSDYTLPKPCTTLITTTPFIRWCITFDDNCLSSFIS